MLLTLVIAWIPWILVFRNTFHFTDNCTELVVAIVAGGSVTLHTLCSLIVRQMHVVESLSNLLRWLVIRLHLRRLYRWIMCGKDVEFATQSQRERPTDEEYYQTVELEYGERLNDAKKIISERRALQRAQRAILEPVHEVTGRRLVTSTNLPRPDLTIATLMYENDDIQRLPPA